MKAPAQPDLAERITGFYLPAILFGTIGFLYLIVVYYQLPNSTPLGVIHSLLIAVFYFLIFSVYLRRPQANRSDRSIKAWFYALTAALILLMPFPVGDPLFVESELLLAITTVVGFISLIWTMLALGVLRSNFSVIPEARSLVTIGLYRYVRHPMYFGETLMGLAAFLPRMSWISLIVFLVYLFAQIKRIQMEEKILTQHFGEDYRTYAQKVKRLIPFIW